MKNPALVFILAASSAVSLRADPPHVVYSPDKRFVTEWFDMGSDKSGDSTRSIFLLDLHHGDKPFSLVTFPRDTRAYWSADSKKCLIINGPDDGGPRTWLFIAKDAGAQPAAVAIQPLKSIQDYFYKHTGDLWRGNITKVAWVDNETVELSAWDQNGHYRIFVKMSAPDQPVVHVQLGNKESRKKKSADL
jgi:hypothetical protein